MRPVCDSSPALSFFASLLRRFRQMERERRDGLIENHAYSIMNAVSIHGEKLVQLRNPWVS